MIATCEDCHGAGSVAYCETWDADLCDDCHIAREEEYAAGYSERLAEATVGAVRGIVYGGYDRGHYKAEYAGGWR